MNTSVSLRHAFDWNTIRCRLLWYYRGPPETQSGTFETVNFITWKILHGAVDVETPNQRVHAGAGNWVIMAHTLGRRHQAFSADARIESLHLGIETQPAEWAGPSIVVLPNSPALSRAIASVGRRVLARSRTGFMPGAHVFMSRDFAEQIRISKQVWTFLAELGPRLAHAGMFIREPNCSNPRVVASLAQIDKWPVNLTWNREQIARSACVSASQLDRLWRENRGETPFQYWNVRRLRFACDRLENSACSIKEIAFGLGFIHLAQFSTWFRTRMNKSPRAYRLAFTR